MRFLSWLLTLFIVVVAVSFALNNAQTVTISLWPFGVEAVTHLYVLALGALFIGLMLGAIISWVSHLPYRFENHRLRRRLADLHDKVEDLRTSAPEEPEEDEDNLLEGPKRRRFWSSHS
jgi:uncharacterized membrane protein YciS (DUF1049 family)